METKDFFKLVEEVKKFCSTDEKKKKLLTNPKKALKEAKIEFPDHVELKFLENTKSTYHFVVPIEKLPKSLQIQKLAKNPSYQEIGLWMIYQIQSGSSLKERILKEPEKVLIEQKVRLAKNLTIKILQNTQGAMYFVLPQNVGLADELTEEETKAVSGGVGKDSMSGFSDFFEHDPAGGDSSGGMFTTGGQTTGSQHGEQSSFGGETKASGSIGGMF